MALKSDELPGRLRVVDAIIEGCGGGAEDRQRFATAWRRLRVAGRVTTEVGLTADQEELAPPPSPLTPADTAEVVELELPRRRPRYRNRRAAVRQPGAGDGRATVLAPNLRLLYVP